MNIPEDIVEKAAQASVNYQARHGDSLPWDALAKFWRDYYREQARAALSAAAPQLMAMAWDEGEQAGYENAKAEDWPTFPQTTNPYRKEAL